ncbi:MAG: hypothetical protein NE328_23345 [Lentisphaeraceae bacterium]|nr:hypothetical protein [Lentisphaeraceae bacterium]
MNFEVSYNNERNYVQVVSSGHIDVKGIVEVLSTVLSSDIWQPGMSLLTDYTDSSTVDLNSDMIGQISYLVKEQKEKLGSGKMAIIMSSELDYGYARMFQLLTEDYIDKEVNVYRDKESAIKWIEAL